ncbi:hypothetical protein [Aestuariivirga litoralis]|uniref:hypothetical protein n=1 Tax=Aestuariivirga litoralis TaxID=2650924 RepID=UPI0018C69F12|nr:hypothetical protein [Aestuariivirga litoralis]
MTKQTRLSKRERDAVADAVAALAVNTVAIAAGDRADVRYWAKINQLALKGLLAAVPA